MKRDLMETALYILHVLVCLAMLPIILLQSGKGGGVSAVFGGGGGGSAMSTRGASTFLTRMTTGAAIVFMCTSLALSVMSSRTRSVVGGVAAPDAAKADAVPVLPTAPAAPGAAPVEAPSAAPEGAPAAEEPANAGGAEPPSDGE